MAGPGANDFGRWLGSGCATVSELPRLSLRRAEEVDLFDHDKISVGSGAPTASLITEPRPRKRPFEITVRCRCSGGEVVHANLIVEPVALARHGVQVDPRAAIVRALECPLVWGITIGIDSNAGLD